MEKCCRQSGAAAHAVLPNGACGKAQGCVENRAPYEPCAGCIDPSPRKARLRMTTVRTCLLGKKSHRSGILRPTFCVGRWIYATGAKADCDLTAFQISPKPAWIRPVPASSHHIEQARCSSSFCCA